METIKINDIEYIKKEEYDKLTEVKAQAEKEKSKAKRFGETHTLKLIKNLSEIFPVRPEAVSEEWMIEKGVMVLDPANVCGVIGKTEEAKRLLAMFYDFETKQKDNPNLDHKAKQDEICKVRLSMEYSLKIMNILKITEDALDITSKYDYPAVFENKDFRFALAPRITNED